MNNNTFPIDALPNIIKDAINEVHKNTQAPVSLIAMSALGAISLACQNQIDVVRYNNVNGPVSLFLMTLAESGERKSTVDKLFMKPIYQMEEEFNQRHKSEMVTYHQDKSIFELKKKSLSKSIDVEYRKGNDTSDIEAQFKELLNSEPKEPIKYKFCFNDATPAAIKDCLSKGWNSIGLMSDEAGVVFEGRALNELGFINKMWDGNPFSVSRKSEEDQYIQDARMTLSLMVQPSIFKEFIQKKGDKVKDIGFLARCLISQPVSTQGQRLIKDTTVFSEHLNQFHVRLKELLDESISNYNQHKTQLHFSPEAEHIWISYYNLIEPGLKESGHLFHHKEFGAKIAENIARISALIHYFSYNNNIISVKSLESASKIQEWFYYEQMRLFPQKNVLNESIQNVNELYDWIKLYCSKHNIKILRRNAILQYGPNHLRKANIVNELINILIQQNKLKSFFSRKTQFIELNFNHMEPQKSKIETLFNINNNS
ncbi:YfjI family protein [Providencia alcalifaciens]|uniref:YfjI family protein n=1 Tax=Providencia alcalifaciens TaxID=126385 RepID=UPI0015ECA1D9|nr:YfjI family protein [Providencia alcalifaciens]QLQ96879.1 DUF3987 domain-containing protein [Providencia alcalifaciens]